MKNIAVSCPGTDRRCNANGFCDNTTGICNCYTGMQGLDCSGKHFLDYVQLLNIQKLIQLQKFQNSSALETAAMLELVIPLQANVYAMMEGMTWIAQVILIVHPFIKIKY